jgi:type IX secretion system PorP/SprF family membrane protein
LKKIYIILSTSLLFTAKSFLINAQTGIYPLRLYFHEIIENPALASVYRDQRIGLSQRVQWPFIDGSPNTTALSFSRQVIDFGRYDSKMMLKKSRLRVKNRAGFGFSFIYDNNGPVSNTSLSAMYAYNLHFSSNTLSLGMAISMNQYTLQYNEFNPANSNDPLLQENEKGVVYPNAALGIYLNGKYIATGISVRNILSFNNLEDLGEQNQNPFVSVVSRYYIRLHSRLLMEPSLHGRISTKNDPFLYRVGARFYYDGKVAFMADYHSHDILSFNIAVDVSKFISVGYGYEFLANGSNVGAFSAHNIFIGSNLSHALSYKTWRRQ